MLCQMCEGSGGVVGLTQERPLRQWVQQCWACDGFGVTPDCRFGPAVIVVGKRGRDHVVAPKAREF